MILNSTNSQRISKVAGTTRVEKWDGITIAIYTEKVQAFGSISDALRIRDYAPKSKELFCNECGAEIVGSGKYTAKAIAERAKVKYGEYLCMDCAMARAEKSAEPEPVQEEQTEEV